MAHRLAVRDEKLTRRNQETPGGRPLPRLEKEVDKEKILCQGPFVMNVTINWKTATGAEKNACIGKWVCGYSAYVTALGQAVADFPTGVEDSGVQEIQAEGLPPYLHSVDALLPWAEKCDMAVEIGRDPCTDMWGVILSGRFISNKQVHTSPCDTLAEALAIALLRANGVEVLT